MNNLIYIVGLVVDLVVREADHVDVVEEQVRGHKTHVAPWLSADTGSLEDWLKKDEPKTRVEVVERETPGAQFARLLFQVRARHAGLVGGRRAPCRVVPLVAPFGATGDAGGTQLVGS